MARGVSPVHPVTCEVMYIQLSRADSIGNAKDAVVSRFGARSGLSAQVRK